MLLSYIDVLVEKDRESKIDYEKNKGLFRSADVYELLIQRWIVREANRINIDRREKFIFDMYKFSITLAVDMFLHREERNGLYIQADDILPFAKKYSINLSELELKGKSLLNRDAIGRFKFAHKSILEFLIAKHAAEDISFAQGVVEFNNLADFDQSARFYGELSLSVKQ